MDKFQRDGRQEKERTSICIAKAKIYRKYRWSGGGVSVYEGLIQVAFSNEKSTGISGMWGKVV